MEGELRKIAILGAGYVGSSLAAVVAAHNPSCRVVVQDINESLVAMYSRKEYRLKEERHSELLDKTVGKNLFFTTDEETTHKDTEVYFICVNTDSKARGLGEGQNLDIFAVRNCVLEICRNHGRLKTPGGFTIVEKSTVPLGTCRYIRRLLEQELSASHPGLLDRIAVVSSPEFSAEGSFIRDLLFPDRVVLGRDSFAQPALEARHAAAERQIEQLYRSFVPEATPFVKTNTHSSELIKLAANSLKAQRISSINSISAICERTGANVEDVSRGAGLDSSIGTRYLQAGIGFGGYCLEKDLRCLVYLAGRLDLPEVAEYWRGVLVINEFQKRRLLRRTLDWFHGTLRGARVLLMGLSFKKDTDDLRNSRAVHLLRSLLEERPSEVALWDPWAERERLAAEFQRLFSESLEECLGRSRTRVRQSSGAEDKVFQVRASGKEELLERLRASQRPSEAQSGGEALHERLEHLRKLVQGADCVLVCIDHSVFGALEPLLLEWMRPGQKLFDAKNIFCPKRFKAKGIELKNFGKGFACHSPRAPL